ncbi:MAG: autotransporter assembly complex protein TamA [Pseudomonadota bacterium]
MTNSVSRGGGGAWRRWMRGVAYLVMVLWSGVAGAVEVRFTVAGEGLPAEVRDDLQKNMAPVQIGDVTQELGSARLAADERLRNALQVYGYYGSQLELHTEAVSESEYVLHYTVIPGMRIHVSDVALAVRGPGAELPVWDRLRQEFPLRQGDVLRQDAYERAKAQWLSAAQDAGYIDAEFSRHVLAIDRAQGTARIELTLNTGTRYVFGEAAFDGAADYPRRFLYRYLAFKPGQVFSYQKLSDTQLNLLNADRFANVSVTPDREAAQGEVMPVRITLESLKPKRFRSGVGYGTDTGARLTARYDDLNFRHSANELHLASDVSERRLGLAGRFVWPSYRDYRSFTSLQSTFQREEFDTYTTRLLGVTLERARGFSSTLIGSAFLTYQNEIFSLGLQRGHSILIMPGVRAQQTRLDQLLRPRKGYRYDVTLRTSYTGWGSDTDFVQLAGRGEARLPLGSRDRIVLRSELGATWQHQGTILDLPPSLRFFAGGDRSVRGYDYRSQGPRDAGGFVVGGRHLLTGSVEFQHDIGGMFGAVVFYDAGNAFDTFADMNVLQSAGVGARAYTPIGPLRLDLAHPLGDPSARNFRIHFSAGVSF